MQIRQQARLPPLSVLPGCLMLTDVKGVLDKKGDLVAEMTATQGHTNIRNGTIKGGMIPKTETCLDAVKGGVEAAVILDGPRTTRPDPRDILPSMVLAR